MLYMIKRFGRGTAHIWDDKFDDTYCRMHSTGGLKQENYMLHDTLDNEPLCKLCDSKYRRSGNATPK